MPSFMMRAGLDILADPMIADDEMEHSQLNGARAEGWNGIGGAGLMIMDNQQQNNDSFFKFS